MFVHGWPSPALQDFELAGELVEVDIGFDYLASLTPRRRAKL